MKLICKNTIIEIENLFLIILISFLFSDKIKMFLTSYYMCYLFITFHELSHILIASIFGKKIRKIKLSIAGVCVNFFEYKDIKYLKNICIYMAGPLSNVLFAFIFKNINFIFEINIFLSVLNLMPVFPLDGYHIINETVSVFNENIRGFIINTIQIVVLLLLFFMSLVVIINTFNPSLLIFFCYVLLIKYAAKNRKK